MKYTAAALRNLRPGEHLTIDGCDGLRIVATETRKTWIYRYKSPLDGGMRQIKIGSAPDMPLSRAIVEWEALREQRQAGRDPAQEKKAARARGAQARAMPAEHERMTTLDVARWYARDIMPGRVRSQRTVDAFSSQVENLLAPSPIAGIYPEDLKRVQAYNLIEALSENPVRTKIFKTNLALAWDRALDSGRIPDTSQNWWRLVHRNSLQSKGKLINGKHVGQIKRMLSTDEIGLTLADVVERKILPDQIADVVVLYLWTGCRGAELVQMRGDALSDDDDGVLWWRLGKEHTKVAGHPLAFDLHVPLIGRARAIVESRRALLGAGWLFPLRSDRSRHIPQGTVATTVHMRQPHSRSNPEHQRGRWSVLQWSCHDLRRSVRTHLAALGCPDKVAENMLGHIDASIEGVYNRHGYTEQKVEWLTKLAARWEDALAAAIERHGPFRPWAETRELPAGVPRL